MAKRSTRGGSSKTTGRSRSAGGKKSAASRSGAAARKKSSSSRAKKSASTRGSKSSGSRKKTAGRKGASKRELIDTGTDKRFVRRGAAGRFKESDDVGRSLARDRRSRAKTRVKSGQGDRGDR